MKIEVGKFYRTRDGRVAEITDIYPLDEDGTDPLSYPVRGRIGETEYSWTREGMELRRAVNEQPTDLIAEIVGAGEGVVETGGCAPPVVVNGPVADVYDAMGDRFPERAADSEPVEIKPVVHDEPPPQADRIMDFAEQIAQAFPPGAAPTRFSAPLVAACSEVQLIGALDEVMYQFGPYGEIAVDDDARRRAVDWLHAKYGSRP